MSWTLRILILLVVAISLAACVMVRRVVREPVNLAQPRSFTNPVKVHLRDGRILMYRSGAEVTKDSIKGRAGMLFTAALDPLPSIPGVRLAEVVGVEVFRSEADAGKTIMYSLLTTAVIKAAVGLTLTPDVGLFKAVFGSCPTIYSDSAGVPVLETEVFSYSIAPLLAKRDIDRLRVQPDADGLIRLEVRNEALETHYIDHMELLEVEHGVHETVYPAAYGAPLAFATSGLPYRASDRIGRDVTPSLAQVDNQDFATDDVVLARATDTDPIDYIDIVLPKPANDSVVLALRTRSSLLTTLLFYEYMLHRPGVAAIDWLGTGMGRIATVAEFGRWYGANMGLRVQVLIDGKYQQVARLADFGPIAYRHVALMIPAAGSDSMRIRLEFTADQWRIDHLAVSTGRRARASKLPVQSVHMPGGGKRDDVRKQIAEGDERDLSTAPGERFFAEFQTTPSPSRRTYLLAAQGYYTEWIRGQWLQTATDTTAFDPGNVRMGALLAEWRKAKPEMEASFFSNKVKPIL